MDIMVFDVPAESGGALSILNDFYQEVVENDDKSVNWIFVLSNPEYKETDNVKILNFPWVKKSWFHRLYFDHFVAPKLVEKYNIDKIFSLQNVIIPKTDVEQILYVHQPLPFSGYKFNIRENFKFWVYQNIINKKIYSSIKEADKVIVQTHWMKDASIEKTGINEDKIDVVPPEINLNIKEKFNVSKNKINRFFFPAGASYYKNHRLIVEVAKLLKEKNISDYKVIFTLDGSENDHINELFKEVQRFNLPIEFRGRLERKDVFNLYTKSYLLFPSYIETFGLPMLEAKLHKTMILASDKAFSHEILDDYENAYFFDPFDKEDLMFNMEKLIKNKLEYENVNLESKIKNKSLYQKVIS
jgi:glycosyltransferase involved in cell wall biosynthesis